MFDLTWISQLPNFNNMLCNMIYNVLAYALRPSVFSLSLTSPSRHATKHNNAQYKAEHCNTHCHLFSVSFMLSVIYKRFELSVVRPNVVMLNVVMLHVVMLNVVMLNVVMLNVVMLIVVMLNVFMLNVVMLNVVASTDLVHFSSFCQYLNKDETISLKTFWSITAIAIWLCKKLACLFLANIFRRA